MINEAVRQPQVNIPPTSYPYIFRPADGQDKLYYSHPVFPQPQGERLPHTRTGLQLGRFPQGMEWKPQQQSIPASPFLQHKTFPAKSSPAGFGPRAYPLIEQDGSHLTRKTFQPESQKFNNWQVRTQPQGQVAPKSTGQGQDPRIFWPHSGLPAALSSGDPTSFRPPSRNASPFYERSSRRPEASPNTHANSATSGYPGGERDRLVSPARPNVPQLQHWEGKSTFMGFPTHYVDPVTFAGNDSYAQPSAYSRLNETAVGRRKSVQKKDDERKQKEPTENSKKAEAPILSSSGREMPLPPQSQTENNDRRLPTSNGTKEDHKSESDSEILQRYLQRAKQVLRQHKDNQEGHRNNNSASNDVPKLSGIPILRNSPATSTESRSSSPSQPFPVSPGRTNSPNPITTLQHPDRTASFDLQQPRQSDDSTSTINREASHLRNPDRTDETAEIQQPAFISTDTDTAKLPQHSPVRGVFVPTSELDAPNRVTAVPKHARGSRHAKSIRRSKKKQNYFDIK